MGYKSEALDWTTKIKNTSELFLGGHVLGNSIKNFTDDSLVFFVIYKNSSEIRTHVDNLKFIRTEKCKNDNHVSIF